MADSWSPSPAEDTVLGRIDILIGVRSYSILQGLRSDNTTFVGVPPNLTRDLETAAVADNDLWGEFAALALEPLLTEVDGFQEVLDPKQIHTCYPNMSPEDQCAVRWALAIFGAVQSDTVVLFDDFGGRCGPKFLGRLHEALSWLLRLRDGRAVLTTTRVEIVQEAPASRVWRCWVGSTHQSPQPTFGGSATEMAEILGQCGYPLWHRRLLEAVDATGCRHAAFAALGLDHAEFVSSLALSIATISELIKDEKSAPTS